ncbi:hypothetical protein Tsubulata_017071 [Turnera subulata]|uniref:WEB family protein n=1 Tax=Turnera subulata TaxID=218843 RepID=A0A9Q0GER5_9ROSI|nr:hypothetical protein Tsubulata_017071 [Turnera subulata]
MVECFGKGKLSKVQLMDAWDDDEEERGELNVHKATELEEQKADSLQEKIEELNKTKEELKRAKDKATQSWLDSRPMIDELEKRQSDLAGAKNQTSMSNVVIMELESQLQVTNNGIKTKIEEELETTKMTHEITRETDQLREELETILKETEEERKERSRLKQVLKMRRQTLRTLQMTLRAIRIESEACAASEAEAQGHIILAETESSSVRLTQEEYHALKKRAKEEKSLAEWRISVSIEQKLAAEASRNIASSKLKEMKRGNRSRRKKTEEGLVMEDANTFKEAEEERQDRRVRGEEQVNRRVTASPKARAKAIANPNRRKPQKVKKIKRSASNGRKKAGGKKKPSILRQFKSFFQCFFR